MSEPEVFCVIPWVNNWDMTEKAALDVMDQEGVGVAPRLLLVGNGVSPEDRERAEKFAEGEWWGPEKRVLNWFHSPPLPSLAATWNRALEFCWGVGARETFVLNNDVRIREWTFAGLLEVLKREEALFVSAVGVMEEQFNETRNTKLIIRQVVTPLSDDKSWKGGPDFSCYLISRECHEKFPFDEAMVPAYCEDLDLHRRIMLAGEGSRIFSVNLPYLHRDNGSNTLKTFSEERREAFHRRVAAGSRAHYQRKWGGPVNSEAFLSPFAMVGEELGTPEYEERRRAVGDLCTTTPQLQAHGCGGRHPIR